MSDESDLPQVRGSEPRTLCPTCSGMGAVSQPKLAVAGGVGRTVSTLQECPQCGGEKVLPGLQPPM